MLTNILLGLILIALIIIIYRRQEERTITTITQDNERALTPSTIRIVDLKSKINKLTDCKEEIIQDCLPKETEQINQINPKHEHTQEQLNILIKLAGKELADEQIKIYFSKATNTLVYRYEDVCVKKEYHGKDFLNYTLLKHNRVIRILYEEDLKEFNKVLFKQEVKEEKIVPEVSEYKEKVKDFMNLKRSTILPDENLLKKTNLSRKMLHRYATEDELKELKELRKTCQSIGIGKIKKGGLRGSL